MTSIPEEIFKCALSGDLETLRQHFESETETEEPQENYFSVKDEVGRNALLTASMLGRSDAVNELVRHGARVNEQTAGGYSSLHLACCWGHVETVKTLLNLGADLQAKTIRGEQPIDLARRYSETDCEDCLMVAEVERELISYFAHVKELVSGSERSLTREEKKLWTRVVSEVSDWIQNVQSPTVSDYVNQRKDLEDRLQSIITKLSA